MATQGTLAALLLTGRAELWMLIAIAALNGVVSAFFFPASQGIVPQTVPAGLIQQANALLRLAINSMPWSAPRSVASSSPRSSPGWAIAVDAATFGLGAVFTALMHLPPIVREQSANFVRELAEGWSAFRSRTLAVVDRPPVLVRQRRLLGRATRARPRSGGRCTSAAPARGGRSSPPSRSA